MTLLRQVASAGAFVLALVAVLAGPVWVHGKSLSEQKIIIAGTGDSQTLLRIMARAFEKRHPDVAIEIPDSIGSSGGIKAVVAGKISLARVARPLKQKEKKFNLTYKPFAKSPIAIVVHPSVTDIDNLNAKQITGIYSGRITDWAQLGAPAGKIYPITRESGDSSKTVLNRLLPGFKEITQPVAKEIYTTPETVEALTEHKNTIGFIPLSMTMGTDLRILKVDGVYPSAENTKCGDYRYVVPFGIVHRGALKGLSKEFVDFPHSREGEKIIQEYGAVPVG